MKTLWIGQNGIKISSQTNPKINSFYDNGIILLPEFDVLHENLEVRSIRWTTFQEGFPFQCEKRFTFRRKPTYNEGKWYSFITGLNVYVKTFNFCIHSIFSDNNFGLGPLMPRDISSKTKGLLFLLTPRFKTLRRKSFRLIPPWRTELSGDLGWRTEFRPHIV